MRAARALVLANGIRPSAAFLRAQRERAAVFIAADGAANGLAEEDPAPDVILGDFDSLDAETRARYPLAHYEPAPDQEASDLEKAVRYALAHGASEVAITGATGTRFDHTLTAFSVLAAHPDGAVRVVEPIWEAFAVESAATIDGRPGDTVSLVAFAPVHVARLTGVRWPLADAILVPGSRGVSNVMAGSRAELVVASGVVLVCRLDLELVAS